jgi:hypothetical protein
MGPCFGYFSYREQRSFLEMKVAKAPLGFPFKDVLQRRVLSCAVRSNATALGVLQAPDFRRCSRQREAWSIPISRVLRLRQLALAAR